MASEEKKGGIFERLANGYFYGEGDDAYIENRYTNELSAEQNRELKKLKWRTLGFSALAGTLGVLLLYLPPHFWPKTFALWSVHMDWFGGFDLPIFSTVYGVVLAVAEIYFLVWLNIRSVHKMALICGFPPKHDPNYRLHIQSLINIGVEKNAKNELSIGLNPWQGYSRFRVIMIFVWTKVRATLSNVVFKMLLRRVLGRYAVRVVVDVAGIPIMAGWNMWAANKVLKQARVRILSPGFIQQSVLYLHGKYKNNEQFKSVIYDILQYLAVRKRSFHENHYLLSVNLLKTFNIPFKEIHEVEKDEFIDKLARLPEDMHDDVAHLIIIGMIIDGNLSFQEKQAIDELSEISIIDYNSAKVEQIMKDFLAGNGKQVLDEQFRMVV